LNEENKSEDGPVLRIESEGGSSKEDLIWQPPEDDELALVLVIDD